MSGAAFADAVLDVIPADALLFRRGNVVGVLAGPCPGSRRFDALDGDRARLLYDRHVRIVSSTQAKRDSGIVVRYEPCSKDLAGLVLAAASTSNVVPELRSVWPSQPAAR